MAKLALAGSCCGFLLVCGVGTSGAEEGTGRLLGVQRRESRRQRRRVCGPALQCHWPAIRQPGTIKHNCKPSDRAHLFSAARGTPALPPGELCSRRSEYAGCPRPVELRAAPHMRAGARLRGEASPPRPQTLSGILESVRKRSERRAPVARLPGLGAAHVPPMLSARRCPLQDPARAPAGECDIQLHLDTARVIL